MNADLSYNKKSGQITISKGKVSFTVVNKKYSFTFFPLRELFEKFGYKIEMYCADHKQICIISPDGVHTGFDYYIEDAISKCRIGNTVYGKEDEPYTYTLLSSKKLLDVTSINNWYIIPDVVDDDLFPDIIGIDNYDNKLDDINPNVMIKIGHGNNIVTTIKVNVLDCNILEILHEKGYTLTTTAQAKVYRSKRINEIIKRHPKWKKNQIEKAVDGYIVIGMPADLVILAFGNPDERNRTVVSSGVHEQWVYSSQNIYVYIDN